MIENGMNEMKRKWLALVCLVMIACLLPLEGLAIRRGDVVRITNSNAVNVRKGPGTGYGVIGEAASDNIYVYLGTENGWHRIIFRDTEGYVSGNRTAIEEGLVPDYVGNGAMVEAVVNVTHYNALNVRKGPGKNYGAMGEAKPGTSWTYLGMDDGWNIIDYNGKTGYIAANRTEVEVADVIGGATSSTMPCRICPGDGVCTTCDGSGSIWHAAEWIYVTCISCEKSGVCWGCGGDGIE